MPRAAAALICLLPAPTVAEPLLDWSMRADAMAEVLVTQESAPDGFGAEGDEYLTLSAGLASDMDDAEDLAAFLSWSRFLAEDFEAILEAGAWSLDPDDDRTWGGSLSVVFRWHFVDADRWSLFADAGIGTLISSDEIPVNGTHLNFLPRAGVGATYRLDSRGTRAVLGIRWHHISNARILGNDNNPARDGAVIYVGVSIPL